MRRPWPHEVASGQSKPGRYILEIIDTARYASDMTQALKELLSPMGK